MIIEYRAGTGHYDQPSRVLRTYKDVTEVRATEGGATYLYGTKPAIMEVEGDFNTILSYAHSYLIAVIKLADGEHLEVVDLPRD